MVILDEGAASPAAPRRGPSAAMPDYMPELSSSPEREPHAPEPHEPHSPPFFGPGEVIPKLQMNWVLERGGAVNTTNTTAAPTQKQDLSSSATTSSAGHAGAVKNGLIDIYADAADT